MRGLIFTEEERMASFSVVNNIASQHAQSNLQLSNASLNKALNRLSSGFRINQSGDDAAGLAVANTYRNDIAILNQGIRNANDGLSVLQIKDAALANIATVLDRMASLATQAGSDAGEADIAKLSSEFNTLTAEIDREAAIAGLTAASTAFSVFVSASNGTIAGTVSGVDLSDLGITQTTFTSVAQAQTALTQVKAAVSTLGTAQNSIGTLQNRLQFAISLSSSQVVNTQAAESRIRDANIAEESANMTRANILSQAGIAALAQANQASSSVLGLLR
jgi:flagellin